MPRVEELDQAVSFDRQLAGEGGPVTMINHFTVAPEDQDRVRDLWQRDADFMKRQPGHVSSQFFKGIEGSHSFVDINVWDDVASLRAAYTHPEFQARLADYPASPVARPHIFRKLDISGG